MTFEVGVKLQTGERFEIEADGDETVADLKNRIEVSFFNQNSLGTNQKIRTRVPTTQYFVLVENISFICSVSFASKSGPNGVNGPALLISAKS